MRARVTKIARKTRRAMSERDRFKSGFRTMNSTAFSFSFMSDLNIVIICAALTISLRIGCPKTLGHARARSREDVEYPNLRDLDSSKAI